MRNLRLIICLILISMCVMVLARTEVEKKTESNKEQIAQMSNLKDEDRLEFLGELCKEFSDIQSNLIYQLNNSQSEEVQFASAFLLGLYRMEQSVRELSKFITLESTQNKKWKREPLWDRYPVVEALIRIGKPSIPEMLKNIRTSNDKKVIELSIRVIRYIEGPEIGRIILEKELEKQKDSQNKAKLEEAISSFDELVEKTTSTPVMEESPEH
jgi:HEAT repeat protein